MFKQNYNSKFQLYNLWLIEFNVIEEVDQTVRHVSILFDCEDVFGWLEPFVFELRVSEWDVLFFG